MKISYRIKSRRIIKIARGHTNWHEGQSKAAKTAPAVNKMTLTIWMLRAAAPLAISLVDAISARFGDAPWAISFCTFASIHSRSSLDKTHKRIAKNEGNKC